MAIKCIPSDDLADLEPNLLLKAGFRVLIGRYKHRPASLLLRNALRLIDQSILEYKWALDDFRLFTKFGAVDGFFRGQGHLENCVNSTHRAITFLERLRRYKLETSDGVHIVPRSKNLEVLTEGVRYRIRDLRNAIMHVDERLVDFQGGEAVAIHPTDSGVELEGIRITWEELSRWLRQLYKLGLDFSKI